MRRTRRSHPDGFGTCGHRGRGQLREFPRPGPGVLQGRRRSSRVPGLMHVRFGPYHVSDLEVVAAFDVDAKKVGCDVADAISASENNTIKIADVPPTGVTVQRGPTFDGLGEYYRDMITESDEPAVDVVAALREAGRRAGLLSAGRPKKWTASMCSARSTPVPPSSTRCRCSSRLSTRSGPRSPPRPACRSWATTSSRRSVRRSRTVCWRSSSRTAASTCCAPSAQRRRQHGLQVHAGAQQARVQEDLEDPVGHLADPHEMEGAAVHIGPSDHVPWLDDRKLAFVRLRAAPSATCRSAWSRSGGLGLPELAGVIIDAIRAAKIARTAASAAGHLGVLVLHEVSA